MMTTEVLRGSAAGWRHVAWVDDPDTARGLVKGNAAGVMLRSAMTGEVHEVELRELPSCLGGWEGDLTAQIVEDIAEHQHAAESAAHIAMLNWSWREVQKSNARCRKYRARLRAEKETERRFRCLVCGDEIVEVIKRTGGRPRIVCESPDCQRTAAADRKRRWLERHRISTESPREVEGREVCAGSEGRTPSLAA